MFQSISLCFKQNNIIGSMGDMNNNWTTIHTQYTLNTHSIHTHQDVKTSTTEVQFHFTRQPRGQMVVPWQNTGLEPFVHGGHRFFVRDDGGGGGQGGSQHGCRERGGRRGRLVSENVGDGQSICHCLTNRKMCICWPLVHVYMLTNRKMRICWPLVDMYRPLVHVYMLTNCTCVYVEQW